MAASLDGFIARTDGSVDWLETSDKFVGGDTMDPGFVAAFLSLNCGSSEHLNRNAGPCVLSCKAKLCATESLQP